MCDTSKLFHLTFPGTATDRFSFGVRKCLYAINYRLSPYFFGELLRSIKSCGLAAKQNSSKISNGNYYLVL